MVACAGSPGQGSAAAHRATRAPTRPSHHALISPAGMSRLQLCSQYTIRLCLRRPASGQQGGTATTTVEAPPRLPTPLTEQDPQLPQEPEEVAQPAVTQPAVLQNSSSVSSSGRSNRAPLPLPLQPPSASTPKMAPQPKPRSIMYYLRRLKWSNVRPQTLGVNMLFVLGVILVNYGIESILDYYLGEDNPLGSCLCILFGAGVVIYLKLKRVPVSQVLLTGFWN